MVIEMMTTDLMTNREIPARNHTMTLAGISFKTFDALKQVSFKTTRAEVLQIIANLRYVFSTYHHAEYIAVEYRETFINQL